MKIALVHDDLVQWGGAERVLAALAEIFPDAPIYTSVYDDKNPILKDHFSQKKIMTSFIQKIPGWKSLYKAFLPLYPIAFEQFDFSQFDLVISQTTRFAKTIITKPQTRHICYCHTPPRFLWDLSPEKTPDVLSPYFNFLRSYDVISSKRVDVWIAGSKNAQERIKKIYHTDSSVILPFVDLERFAGMESFNGGYLLVISRLNFYKRVDLVIKVANKLKVPLKIVGTGPKLQVLQSIAGPTVDFLGAVPDDLLIQLLAGCKALVIAAEEDFGLTALEAQAAGKPVVAFGKGGVLETVQDKKTGYLFVKQTEEALGKSLMDLDRNGYNRSMCVKNAALFSKEKFKENFRFKITSLSQDKNPKLPSLDLREGSS